MKHLPLLGRKKTDKAELEPKRYLFKRMERMERCLRETVRGVEGVAPAPDADRCLLEYHKEVISGPKQELLEVSRNIT